MEVSTPNAVADAKTEYAGSRVSLDNKMAEGNNRAGDDKDAVGTDDWEWADERAGSNLAYAMTAGWLLLWSLKSTAGVAEATLNSSAWCSRSLLLKGPVVGV
jgi:hypothetical protein